MSKISKIITVLWILSISLTSCSSAKPSKPEEIMVFAAASMTESMTELGKAFEVSEGGKVKTVFNFAGSQSLKTSLESGAEADIFISANVDAMKELEDKGLVSGYKVFLKNRLVIIKNRKSPYKITKLEDLTADGIRIAAGDKSVPVGSYWSKALEEAVKERTISEDDRKMILKNVKTEELNVKDVVSKVLLNEVDAGIVYRTDVTGANSADIEEIEIPLFEKLIAEYPVGVIKNSDGDREVRKFYEYILSEKGRKIFKKYRFMTDSE